MRAVKESIWMPTCVYVCLSESYKFHKDPFKRVRCPQPQRNAAAMPHRKIDRMWIEYCAFHLTHLGAYLLHIISSRILCHFSSIVFALYRRSVIQALSVENATFPIPRMASEYFSGQLPFVFECFIAANHLSPLIHPPNMEQLAFLSGQPELGYISLCVPW